jgi:hypothetical protein
MMLGLSLAITQPRLAGAGAVPPAVYDYVIIHDGDASTPNSFLKTLADIEADGTGGTVGVYQPSDAVYYSKTIITLSTTTAPVIFQAAELGVRIDRVVNETSDAEIHLIGLELVSYETPMVDPVIKCDDVAGDFHVIDCDVKGNWHGDPDFAFDPTAAYEEYGHVRAAVSGGLITGGTIIHPFIGNNWGDGSTDTGTATITIQNNSTTHPSGTVATGWSVNIVAGVITGVNAGTSGTGYQSSAASLEQIFDIDGRVTPRDLLGAGFQTGGVCTGRMYFTNNRFSLLGDGIKPSYGDMEIVGNSFDLMCGDSVSFKAHLTNGNIFVCNDNFFTRPIVRDDDFGNPHADCIQGEASLLTADCLVEIERNVAMNGTTRGYTQGVHLADTSAANTHAYSGRICDNIFAVDGAVNAILVSRIRDFMMKGNTACKYDVARADGKNVGVTASIILQEKAYGSVYWGLNLAEGITSMPSGVKVEGNVLLTVNSAADYTAKFVLPHSLPATKTAALAAFVTQGAAIACGAQRPSSGVDFVAGTTDLTLEPTYGRAAPTLNAPLSTASASGWCRIVGGPDSGSYSVTGTGFAVEFANDNIGTGSASGGTSGTYDLTTKPYFRLTRTTGAVNNVTESGTVTWRAAYATQWLITTTPAGSYAGVDNQNAAWSLLAAPGLGTATNHNMAVISAEIRFDAISNSRQIFARTTSQDQIQTTTGNILHVNFASAGVNARTVDALTAGSYMRIIILIDTTTSRIQVIIDTERKLLSTAAITLNDTLDLNAIFNTGAGYAMFASNTGTNLMNGAMRYFYWHSWNKAARPNLAIPLADTDAEVAAWYNRFSPDTVGANGNGVLTDSVLGAEQPLGFWNFDTTAANDAGGQPNLGSVASRPFIKQASTYV